MPLPRFWYLPRGVKAAVVLTGDDHNYQHGGTNGQFNRYLADSPPGCSVALWQCVRSTSYLFPGRTSRTPRRRPSRPRASSSRCTSGSRGPRQAPATATATTRAPRPSPTTCRPAAVSARPTRASPRRRPTATTASSRATGPASRASSSPTASAWTPTTTTGPPLGPGPPRLLHRLGLPDALRRDRRLAHRRLPGRHAAHRRVRTGRRRRDQGPARQRHRARRLLRRRHGQHAHRRTGQPRRRRDHRRRAGPRGARRLGAPDAHVARRPQQLVLPGPGLQRWAPDLHRGPGRRRDRAAGDAPRERADRRPAVDRPQRPARGLRDADDQGHRPTRPSPRTAAPTSPPIPRPRPWRRPRAPPAGRRRRSGPSRFSHGAPRHRPSRA